MSNTQIAGHCEKCGAPYSTPIIWHGTTPPPLTPTCGCWGTSSGTITIKDSTGSHENTKITEVKVQDGLDYHLMIKCSVCSGSGNKNYPNPESPALTCHRCNGKGWYVK